MSRNTFAARLFALVFSCLSLASEAATITVNSTADTSANDGLCTLREAIIAANTNTASGAAVGECAAGVASPTVDSIVFNISGSGVQTITPGSVLPDITQDVTIDGGNGGVATNRVQISGGGALGQGLSVNGPSNVTIRNLVINGFTQREILYIGGSGQVVQGNFLGVDPTGTTAVANSAIGIDVCCGTTIAIGGTTAAARNVVTSSTGTLAVSIEASSATIQGNFIGLNAAGTVHIGNPGTGIQVSNAGATVGGTTPGAGNAIAAFTGIRFGGNPALGHSSGSVQGNFIGTDVTGTVALNLGNGAGVSLEHAIGALISGNLISGNGQGVIISSSGISGATSSNNTVQGNRIGTAADGVTALGNSSHGVECTGTTNLIGGDTAGQGNIIAFNGGAGVLIESGSLGNSILGNSIFSNGNLGIALSNPTVPTPNDTGDGDTGSNNLQNYPVITAASVNVGNTTVSGTLNSTASANFRVEFFGSPTADPSGFGEGKTFLGSAIVTTSGTGNAMFTNLVLPATGGPVITSTATRFFGVAAVVAGEVPPKGAIPYGDSSEFSQVFLTALPPPTIAKQFGAASITAGSTTSLTFTITNTAQGNGALTGVAFTDTLPLGLVVATPNGINGVCGGTVTAAAGGGTVSLTGGTLAAGGSCTISVNVKGMFAGVQNNSVSVTSTEGGAGNTANASVTVTLLPPVITKAFLGSNIGAGALSQVGLRFTINNPNPQNAFDPTTNRLTGIGFTDTLPGGLILFTPPGLVASCSGVTATGGSNMITMTGGTVGASLTCTIDVTVNAPAGTTPGLKHNVTSNVTSTEAGAGNSASADITVQGPTFTPPIFSKQFGTQSIVVGGGTTLTFTITNSNQASLSGMAFSDTLPAGLVVATPNGASNTCGGAVTATAGTGVVNLSGGTLGAGAQCQIAVNVTGTTSGTKNNVTSNITTTESAAGGTASATLTVTTITPPTITKSFGAATIALNGTTTLTFALSNPNASATLNNVSFTDTLPAGLVVSTPNNLTGTCGGGTITATAAGGTVTLAGATLPASGQCTFSVNVTGTASGTKSNSVTVASTNGGTGNTSTATLTVVAATLPPTIAKAFGGATVSPGGVTTLTFTLTNPNAATALTGLGFTDVFPGGLIVATPNGLSGICGGGTITAVAGSSSASLSSASLAASGSCTFTVNVTATGTGSQTNVTSVVTSTEGGNGGTATASLTIIAARAADIPTLQEWALALLASLLALGAALVLIRRRGRNLN